MKVLGGCAIVAAILCGCSSGGHLPVAAATASASASAKASPTVSPMQRAAPTFHASPIPSIDCSLQRTAPTFAPAAPSMRSLALISTDAYGTNFVVQDVTDIGHPFTVSDLTHQVRSLAQFADAADVSYADDAAGLVRKPLSGSPTTVVAPCGTRTFAWSADGTAAAYIAATANPKVQALHLVANGEDHVAETMPAFDGAVGCESRGQGCWETWETSILFSQDGAYVSFLEQLAGFSIFRIWTSSGKLLKSVDGTAATMQVWAGNTLYWRDDSGIESWREGGESLALPGVSWVRPYASPAGGQIVYTTLDAALMVHIHLLDTRTLQSRELASLRGEPRFLTSRYLWYVGDKCSAPCTNPERNGQYVYDLQTATESPSTITFVWDAWPHPA